MNRFTQLLVAASLFCLVAACSSEAPGKDEAAAPAENVITHYSGARLIPGDGSPAIENASFIVENSKFTAIGTRQEVVPPRGGGRVELNGMTIMPILVNLNAHVGLTNGPSFGPENYKRESITADLNRYGYYGLAAVAVQGTDAGDLAFEIRNEQTQGKATGARLFTSGRGFTAKGGYPSAIAKDVPLQVGTEAEARQGVADMVAKKVDFVSIMMEDNMGRAPKLTPQLYKAIIDEAHKNNLKAFASPFYLADAKELVRSGIDGLVTSVRDREVDDEFISLMKEKNIFYAPSLTGQEAKFVYADKPSWLGEQTMREVYPAQLSAYLADSVVVNRFRRNGDLGALRTQYSTAQKNLKKLSDAGVKIAMGSNSGMPDTYPGYFELRELELMAAAGMAPAEVIKAATSVSAAALGLSDYGTLAVGKKADFFVLNSDPLENITNLKNISVIYDEGEELDRGGLIQNITIDVPRITQADRVADQQANAAAALQAKIDAMPHYGKFPLGPSANVRAMPVPTPYGSKADIRTGPPDRITVSARGSAADLREFYAKALPQYRWQAAGECWQRNNPLSNKPQVLCVEAAANSAVIQISEK